MRAVEGHGLDEVVDRSGGRDVLGRRGRVVVVVVGLVVEVVVVTTLVVVVVPALSSWPHVRGIGG